MPSSCGPHLGARMGACEPTPTEVVRGLLAIRSCAGPHRCQGRSSPGRSTLTPAAADGSSHHEKPANASHHRRTGSACALDRARPHGSGNAVLSSWIQPTSMHRRSATSVGGSAALPQPGQADQGQPLAGRGTDRVRLAAARSRDTYLPGRPAAGGWPAASASRRPRSPVGTRSWSRLASAHRRLRRPGPRRRLLHPARHRAPASTGRRQLQAPGYQVTLQPAAEHPEDAHIRMRPLVQVLPGPPTNPAGHGHADRSSTLTPPADLSGSCHPRATLTGGRIPRGVRCSPSTQAARVVGIQTRRVKLLPVDLAGRSLWPTRLTWISTALRVAADALAW